MTLPRQGPWSHPHCMISGACVGSSNSTSLVTLSLVMLIYACRSIGWELPNNIPFEAKKTLIREFTSMWATPALVCFNDIFSALERHIAQLIRDCFGSFKFLKQSMEYVLRCSIRDDPNTIFDRESVNKQLSLVREAAFSDISFDGLMSCF